MATAPLLLETDRPCGTSTHWHPDSESTNTLTLSRQVARHLWTGERSVMRRLLRGAAGGLADAALSRGLSVSVNPEELLRLLQVCRSGRHDLLSPLGSAVPPSPSLPVADEDVGPSWDVAHRFFLLQRQNLGVGGHLAGLAQACMRPVATAEVFNRCKHLRSAATACRCLSVQLLSVCVSVCFTLRRWESLSPGPAKLQGLQSRVFLHTRHLVARGIADR